MERSLISNASWASAYNYLHALTNIPSSWWSIIIIICLIVFCHPHVPRSSMTRCDPRHPHLYHPPPLYLRPTSRQRGLVWEKGCRAMGCDDPSPPPMMHMQRPLSITVGQSMLMAVQINCVPDSGQSTAWSTLRGRSSRQKSCFGNNKYQTF
jgi:hypothetical protein